MPHRSSATILEAMREHRETETTETKFNLEAFRQEMARFT
jgi:hypothetical protein